MLLFAFFGRGAATTRAHAHNASFDLLPFLPRLASCWCRLCVLALDIMSLSSEASSSGLAKRPKIDTSKHSVGYQQSWEKEYPWLMAVESGGEVTGMLCSLCKRHKTKNKQNQSSVWGSTPCTCLRKDSVRHHAKSAQHLGAVELETHRVAAERDGGIAQAFQTQINLQKQPIKGAMQCLYWLVHSEIPTQPNIVV